jgi:alpha-tubulin suppressor-like RCC1 family protein
MGSARSAAAVVVAAALWTAVVVGFAASPASAATLPGAPTAGAAVPGVGQATVSWSAPSSDGGSPITGYVVTPYVGYFPLVPRTFASAVTTQVVTGLTNGTQYRFRVQAVNGEGTGAYSTVTNPVTPTTVPGPPTPGSAVSGDGQVIVSWSPPSTDGGSPITGYVVTPYMGFFALAPRTFASTATTQVVTGLNNGTSLRFRVQAVNSVGAGAHSTVTNPAVPGPAIAVGGEHSCAVVAGGAVKCWGDNHLGELGDGTTISSAVPVTVSGISGAVAVAAGFAHTCAVVRPEGAVYCWGGNDQGQLGSGEPGGLVASPLPVRVPGITGAVSVAAGGDYVEGFSCALLETGTVYCWGTGGRLGNPAGLEFSPPVQVVGLTGAFAISAGDEHACALVVGGSAFCWGSNWVGQLGNGTTTMASTPVRVSGLTSASAITAGFLHTCAVVRGGAVMCWGSNAGEQLGTGTATSSLVPVPVIGLTQATAVAAGQFHSCAVVSTTTTVQCWGDNSQGQLGNGSTMSSSVPVPATQLAGAVTVAGARFASSTFHLCAGTATGGVHCWGSNWSGQLGDGTTTDSPVPVQVVGL